MKTIYLVVLLSCGSAPVAYAPTLSCPSVATEVPSHCCPSEEGFSRCVHGQIYLCVERLPENYCYASELVNGVCPAGVMHPSDPDVRDVWLGVTGLTCGR